MAIKRTYGRLYLKEGRWVISEAQPHICIKLKAIFNKLPKYQKEFYFPDTPENCNDLDWFMQRYPLAISDSDNEKLKSQKENHIQTLNELETILLPDYKPQCMMLKSGYSGRDYQIKGVEVYLKCKRLLIGDDIGLGKTIIGILSMLKIETLPAIVVVQTHLIIQWRDEIQKFTNLKYHFIKKRSVYNLPPADIYIIKYSCLSGWVDIFNQKYFKSAIFDECQELRRAESDKYKSARALSLNVEYCIGLSASPIYNFGDEIYNVIDLINQGSLGKRDDFMREWVGSGFKKVMDPKALGSYLRENFLMLRRTREEVGRELPPVNKIIQYVEYDEIAVKKSEDIAKQLAIKVTSGSFVERGSAARELDIFVRHNTGVSKALGVAAYLKILLENDEPVLVAAWHRDVYDILLQELAEYKPVMYTGSESPTQKEKAKQAFLSGETNCFIISLRSGIGLDGLQKRCNTVVIAELDWSPKVHDQVIGRVDRDGQTNQVTVIYLVVNCGSDPLIIDLLGLKSSQSHGIMNPLDIEIHNQTSDETRIKMLAQQYLKTKHPSIVQPSLF
jgi:SNF2 family DNA or RNA helicase